MTEKERQQMQDAKYIIETRSCTDIPCHDCFINLVYGLCSGNNVYTITADSIALSHKYLSRFTNEELLEVLI